MKAKRNSNIEFLRIISMLLIVVGHCFGTRFEGYNKSLNIFLSNIVLGSWAILGVDIFVIISAWFLNEQHFKTKRVISVLFEAVCYIVAFDILYAILTGINTGSVSIAVKSAVLFCFDGLFKQYHWFVAAYIMMCFASPFLNKMLNSLNQKSTRVVLLIATAAFILQNFWGVGYYSFIADSADLFYIYIIVGYIKRYGLNIKKPLWAAIITFAVVVASKTSLRFISDDGIWFYAKKLIEVTVANSYRYSPILLLLAICIFGFVTKLPIWHNRFINSVASATFGVYLFHETYIPIAYSYVSPATMQTVNQSQVSLKNIIVGWFCDSGWITYDIWFAVKMLSVAILIFVCGVIIEIFRNNSLQAPFMKLISKKAGSGLNGIDNLFNSF